MASSSTRQSKYALFRYAAATPKYYYLSASINQKGPTGREGLQKWIEENK
jgi:hypothetical protein